MSRESVEGEIRGACARICEQLDGIADEWGTAAELRAERDDLEARLDQTKNGYDRLAGEWDEVRAERDDLEGQVTSLLGVIDEHDMRIANLADRLLLITAALDDHDAPEADTPVHRIELWAAEWRRQFYDYRKRDGATICDLRKRLAEQQKRADRLLLDGDEAVKQADRLVVLRIGDTETIADLRAQVERMRTARDDETGRADAAELEVSELQRVRRTLEADNSRLDIELADCRAKNDELSGWLANPDSRDADRATDWRVVSLPPGSTTAQGTYVMDATVDEVQRMADNLTDHTQIAIYRLHSRLVSESRSGWVDAS